MENEEQQRQDSSHEKVQALVDQAKSRAQKKAGQVASKGAKKGGKLVAQAGKRLAVQAGRQLAVAVATNPIAWIVIGVILFIIIITVIIVVIFGEQDNVPVAPPLMCESISGGNCQATACTGTDVPDTTGATCTTDPAKLLCCAPPGTNASCDGDPAKYMRDTFSIVAQTSVKSQLTTICNILSIPGKSSLYTSLLKRGGPTNISFDSAPCGGRVNGDGSIILHSFWSCGSAQSFVLIHETGHTIAIYNGQISRRFTSEAYYPNDSSCYYYNSSCGGTKYFLKTYTSGCGGGGKPESFAESVALYVSPKGALSNYQSQCPTGYNWEKNNIFGGYEF